MFKYWSREIKNIALMNVPKSMHSNMLSEKK